MKNRSRMAAKVTGVVAAGALLFGVVGAAGAASQAVEYKLDSGSVTLGTGDPFVLNPATGVTGTWDDVTGDFTGTFTSAPTASVLDTLVQVAPAPAPKTPAAVSVVITNIPLGPATGNIDPTTGNGNVALGLNVEILLESVSIDGGAAVPLGITCNINPMNIPFAVTATGLGAESAIFTNLNLSASGFTVNAATCTGGTNPALLPLVTTGLNESIGIIAPATTTTQTAAALALSAGAIPPPASTTTTTIVTTTTTTAAPAAAPAAAVNTTAKFTG
jgi:hypothetical protein